MDVDGRRRVVVGDRYGRLLVKEQMPPGYRGHNRYWACRCDCGKDTVVRNTHLSTGKIKSCGCLGRTHAITHGKSYSRTYNSWIEAIQRCHNPKKPNYHNYGGRGIRVCDEWREFDRFMSDMGECPPRCSLDRIDVNGNYEPGNCRWATTSQQANNRRTNRRVEYRGQVYTIAQLRDISGVNHDTLLRRLARGLSVEEAVNKPLRRVGVMDTRKGEGHGSVEG